MDNSLATSLQEGLRRLAKAVVIITTKSSSERFAMAATAVSELSLDPPSLLMCVNKSASLFPILSVGSPFCINILHASQLDISVACAGARKGAARFEVGDWIDTDLGAPMLVNAQASFSCKVDQKIDYGTHAIFIGLVDQVVMDGIVEPLIYVDGTYAGVGARFASR